MITQERLKEMLSYSEETGVFTWLVTGRGRVRIGDVAGCISSDGYVVIGIDKILYRAHRLVWLYVHGYFPENHTDHINRVRHDNRIENLREVSVQCNIRNYGNNIRSTSGVRGVCWSKKMQKWKGHVMVDQKTLHLGYHEDIVEAVAHRLAFEQCLGWDICGNNSPAYEYMQRWLSGN